MNIKENKTQKAWLDLLMRNAAPQVAQDYVEMLHGEIIYLRESIANLNAMCAYLKSQLDDMHTKYKLEKPYYCTLCGQHEVDARGGFDTCPQCLQAIQGGGK